MADELRSLGAEAILSKSFDARATHLILSKLMF